MKNLRAHRIVLNRNGISGRSFWSVYFSYEDGRVAEFGNMFRPNMLAIVPNSDDGPLEVDNCFVVNLSDPDSTWKGSDLAKQVIYAIQKYHG